MSPSSQCKGNGCRAFWPRVGVGGTALGQVGGLGLYRSVHRRFSGPSAARPPICHGGGRERQLPRGALRGGLAALHPAAPALHSAIAEVARGRPKAPAAVPPSPALPWRATQPAPFLPLRLSWLQCSGAAAPWQSLRRRTPSLGTAQSVGESSGFLAEGQAGERGTGIETHGAGLGGLCQPFRAPRPMEGQ